MSSLFEDRFSVQSSTYARYRPTYPAALFQWLAEQAPGLERAWDCATGNGQAARGLIAHFQRVVATDASAEQIAHAIRHRRIEYRVAPAEDAPLADRSVDVVTVAQALHWLDLDRFYAEVRRVARPQAVLAVWSYIEAKIEESIDDIMRHYRAEVVGPYWRPAVRKVESGYGTLPFPFTELEPPSFVAEATWTLSDALGYIGSWSASQAYIDDRGADPRDEIAAALAAAWGDPERARRVRWPLSLRAGRVDAQAVV